MKIQKFDIGVIERRILTTLITDTITLGNISSKWGDGLFKNPWANIVGGWCVRYYQKYEKAPHRQIEQLYERWAARSKDAATTELIDKYLSGISEEYEPDPNHDSRAATDMALEHFNKVQLQQLGHEISNGEPVTESIRKVTGFNCLSLAGQKKHGVTTDQEKIEAVFRDPVKPLVTYSEAAGKFFGNQLAKDSLVSFMGPCKSGKTFWLLDVAWRAMVQRKRTVFFEVGDLTESQIMRRFLIRAAKHPLFPGTVYWPTKVIPQAKQETAEVEADPIVFTEGLDLAKARAACEKINTKSKSNLPLLNLCCSRAGGVSIADIRTQLNDWERQEGWSPECIVIDYADLLAPCDPKRDLRDQINDTWTKMRALSQERNCLVLTATQSDAKSFHARWLNRDHFSNDRRKLDHVTGMCGLNVGTEEKKRGVTRLNWVVCREADVAPITCAGTLALASPIVVSAFGKDE